MTQYVFINTVLSMTRESILAGGCWVSFAKHNTDNVLIFAAKVEVKSSKLVNSQFLQTVLKMH